MKSFHGAFGDSLEQPTAISPLTRRKRVGDGLKILYSQIASGYVFNFLTVNPMFLPFSGITVDYTDVINLPCFEAGKKPCGENAEKQSREERRPDKNCIVKT
jgi:hypothetical protein